MAAGIVNAMWMTATTGFSIVMLTTGLFSGVASAQSAAGCTLEQIGGTSRQIVRCGQGVTVTAEGDASFDLVDRNGDASPDAVNLRGKALLIDVDSSQKTDGFEVVTPQAIAAVRGTLWAVDVSGGTTAVLVVRGSVAVNRSLTQSTVTLGPGEGVDVTDGGGELVVRTWPAARAAALLARLGQ
jgi:hypothetical protein